MAQCLLLASVELRKKGQKGKTVRSLFVGDFVGTHSSLFSVDSKVVRSPLNDELIFAGNRIADKVQCPLGPPPNTPCSGSLMNCSCSVDRTEFCLPENRNPRLTPTKSALFLYNEVLLIRGVRETDCSSRNSP